MKLRFLGRNGGRCPKCNNKGEPVHLNSGIFKCPTCTKIREDARANDVANMRSKGLKTQAQAISSLDVTFIYMIPEERLMLIHDQPMLYVLEERDFEDSIATLLLSSESNLFEVVDDSV